MPMQPRIVVYRFVAAETVLGSADLNTLGSEERLRRRIAQQPATVGRG